LKKEVEGERIFSSLKIRGKVYFSFKKSRKDKFFLEQEKRKKEKKERLKKPYRKPTKVSR